MINTTTRTTVVSSAELDNNVWVRLLKEERFKSALHLGDVYSNDR